MLQADWAEPKGEALVGGRGVVPRQPWELCDAGHLT